MWLQMGENENVQFFSLEGGSGVITDKQELKEHIYDFYFFKKI
jgi:hypothetical protein